MCSPLRSASVAPKRLGSVDHALNYYDGLDSISDLEELLDLLRVPTKPSALWEPASRKQETQARDVTTSASQETPEHIAAS